MQQESGLKIYSYIEVPSSGYPGEGVDSSNDAPKDPGTEGEWHDFDATYWYHDCNLLKNPTDKSSTQVNVSITQEYMYKRTLGNHYQVTVRGWLTKIDRCCKNEEAGIVSPRPGRTIQVWGVNGNSVWGPTETVTSNEGNIFSGKLFLGQNTYDLKPGEKTPLDSLSADYRSYTTGYWAPGGPIPSSFLDQMHMGLMFENTLPTECDPPKIVTITQEDDICENEVTACLIFAPCSCDGMGLRLEYMFPGDTWENAKAKGQYVEIPASYETSNRVCLYNLPPTNHTNNVLAMNWRAKFYPIESDMPETKWTTEQLEMMFILAPHETVPDISPEECLKLQRGDLIPKYETETCYNELSCADVTVQTDSRVTATQGCKIVNGVSS